MDNKQLY